jgi:hypothetical protein
VEKRREAAGPPIDVGRHEHIVVEAEDRVVHGEGVKSELDPRSPAAGRDSQAKSGSSRQACRRDLPPRRARLPSRTLGQPTRDADGASGRCLAAHKVDEPRTVLRQVQECVHEQIDVPASSAEQLPLQIRGEVGAVRIGVDQLGRGRNGSREATPGHRYPSSRLTIRFGRPESRLRPRRCELAPGCLRPTGS